MISGCCICRDVDTWMKSESGGMYGSCARGEEKYSSDVDLFLELSESFLSRPELKKYLYLLKSEVSSDELDDSETDLKIVVGDEWKKNKMLYYANVRKEGIQIWP